MGIKLIFRKNDPVTPDTVSDVPYDNFVYGYNNTLLGAETLDELKQALHYRYPILLQDSAFLKGTEKETMKVWGLLKANKQYPVDFDYTINSFGFRGNEVSTDVDVCYYGCSTTYGQGVPDDAIFTSVVDKNMNFTSNNFGLRGAGDNEIFNVFVSTTKFIKMKRAVFVFPELDRITLPIRKKSGIEFMNLYNNYYELFDRDHPLFLAGESFYKMPDEYFIDRFKYNIQQIMYIADLVGIEEVYISSWSTAVNRFLTKIQQKKFKTIPSFQRSINLEKKDSGRDLIHPGINWHEQFANDIMKAL